MADSNHVDICLVEDDQSQQKLLTRMLEREGFTVAVASDYQSGYELICECKPKVACIDYCLPDGDGVELCKLVRRETEATGTYFILVTAFGSDELEWDAISQGADDYITKPVEKIGLVSRCRVGTRMWSMHDRLRKAAITDGLTGLYNHDYLIRVLESEMARSRRYGHPLSMIMVDIDDFKAVNDTYGHLAGNAVLEQISEVLKKDVREVDTVGRFGGEEFAVVLPEATVADIESVAERMRVSIMESVNVPVLRGHRVTASFGMVDSDDPRVRNTRELVDLADQALYLAKRKGKNQVVAASAVNERNAEEEHVKTDDVESLRHRVAVLSVKAKEVYVQSVASLVQALDERDPYTARHARNVAFYAERIAERMGCSKALCNSVSNAALLHDIGKVGVPDHILLKASPLTDREMELMARVPQMSTRIVDHLRILESELQIIRHQREYYDGSGTPCGLEGNQIPIGARILLVADAFDAMTTNRVYRQRRTISDVSSELNRLSGTQFDPNAVSTLRRILDSEGDAWQRRIDETVSELSALTSA